MIFYFRDCTSFSVLFCDFHQWKWPQMIGNRSKSPRISEHQLIPGWFSIHTRLILVTCFPRDLISKLVVKWERKSAYLTSDSSAFTCESGDNGYATLFRTELIWISHQCQTISAIIKVPRLTQLEVYSLWNKLITWTFQFLIPVKKMDRTVGLQSASTADVGLLSEECQPAKNDRLDIEMRFIYWRNDKTCVRIILSENHR